MPCKSAKISCKTTSLELKQPWQAIPALWEAQNKWQSTPPPRRSPGVQSVPLGALLGLRKAELCAPAAGRALPQPQPPPAAPAPPLGPDGSCFLSSKSLSGAHGLHQDDMVTCQESVRCSGAPEDSEAPLCSEDSSPPGPFSSESSKAQHRPEVAHRPPLPVTASRAGSLPPDLVRKERIKPALSPATAAGHRGTLLVLWPCCMAACPRAPQPCGSAARAASSSGDCASRFTCKSRPSEDT